jgi:hypothetical protein
MESRHMKTACRRLTMLLAVGHFLAAEAYADQASRLERKQAPREINASLRKPQIGRGFSAKDAFALKLAYRGAIKRLEKDQSCRALFDNLNLGGLQALVRSRYQPVRSEVERAYCARGVHAYTAVGRDQIVICRHFHTLNQRTKEGVLIHEALHTAGMSEAPHDPDGETPEEITEMVEKACSLSF